MMQTVWYYAYHYHGGRRIDPRELALPCGAQPLEIHYEDGVLGIWVLLDPAKMASQMWTIWVVRMGEEFDAPAGSTIHYLGSLEKGGPDTLHYFAARKREQQ